MDSGLQTNGLTADTENADYQMASSETTVEVGKRTFFLREEEVTVYGMMTDIFIFTYPCLGKSEALNSC